MLRQLGRLMQWCTAVTLVGCLCLQVAHAASSSADTDALLKQAWDLQVTDHRRSLQLLAQLNQRIASLTREQQWQVRFMNAWEAQYAGHYKKAENLYKDIITHSGDPKLADRAAAMLLGEYGITQRYTEAFELANRLAGKLPQVKDAQARYALLLGLSQAMGLAGQTDLAVHYAHLAMKASSTAARRCFTSGIWVSMLLQGHRLKPGDPVLQQAFDACPESTEPLFNTSLTLALVDLYAHGGEPRRALALLDGIQPRVDASGYVPYKLAALLDRARALAALGDDAAARKAALAVVAAGVSSDFNLWLKDAYEVLYRIEKKRGHPAEALDYYEKYAALDRIYLDDINARTMAYEAVQQHLLAQKLETEKLNRQNETLQLQQKLDAKTAEVGRLCLVLLFVVLAIVMVGMFRLKRSQLRFRRLSELDGLTTTYNRQHFMDAAARMLRLLENRQGMACLAIIDLDHFKSVNDTHGHAMGDETLRCVADTCRQQLRPNDLFGRLGGEEFGILLVDCPREHGRQVANRIHRAIEHAAIQHDGISVAVTVSMGLACTDNANHDLRTLSAKADAALYRAKNGGRNRVVADGGEPMPA
ncbi:MAG: hypothetical protein RSP_10470 [Rhodanobacter sp.]